VVGIQKYVEPLTADQIHQFEQLEDLYGDWNSLINVISRKDIEHFFIRHLLHSVTLQRVVKFEKGSSVLDVGTGGGLPGIPLAILFPDVQFHLVDSIGKKIKVVNAISKALELKNVETSHSRVEDLDGKYDYIVSRAVTKLVPFYGWIKNSFKAKLPVNGGLYTLKGGDLDEEIREFKSAYPKKKVEVYGLAAVHEDSFFETKKIVQVTNV